MISSCLRPHPLQGEGHNFSQSEETVLRITTTQFVVQREIVAFPPKLVVEKYLVLKYEYSP